MGHCRNVEMRNFPCSEAGAAMVEFAIVLPLFVLILLGGSYFSQFALNKSLFSRAASSSAHILGVSAAEDPDPFSVFVAADSAFRQQAMMGDASRYRIFMRKLAVLPDGVHEIWSNEAGTLPASATNVVVNGVLSGVDAAAFQPGDVFFVLEYFAAPSMIFSGVYGSPVIHGRFIDQAYYDPCLESSAVAGRVCWDGGILMGDISGRAIVMSPADVSASAVYSTDMLDVAQAHDENDGRGNTDAIVNLPGAAAAQCHGLGRSWFMPAIGELSVLSLNAAAAPTNALASVPYWSSTMVSSTLAKSLDVGTGLVDGAASKSSAYRLRCIRNLF